jgi:hypothetical protein
MKQLQTADTTSRRPDQEVYLKRLGDWAKRNSSYLGVIALFAGLGILAANRFWSVVPVTEMYGRVGIWEPDGPIGTGVCSLVFGAFAGAAAVVLLIKGPVEEAKRRNIYRAVAALLALAAFGVTYFTTVLSVTTVDRVKLTDLDIKPYYMLDQSAMTGAHAVAIPLTLAGGGVVVVNGCLYLKAHFKRSES